MNLVKEVNKQRIKGMLFGAFLPIGLLLIVGLYGFYISKPWVIGENSFAAAPGTYIGVVWVYLISVNYYHVFFCLSANMLAVWFLTNKNKNAIANGVVLPTALYAVLLVVVRLL
tara:strand:+ start:437 stop:778 length:342 start_codon:yes stop_codon:yes gene_type:complete